MGILWDDEDWLTSPEVRERLRHEHDVTLTTVTTVLTRLWKKGRLQRRPRGRSNEYRPVDTREEYAAGRMEEMLETTRDRSVALHHFLDQLSAGDRHRLRELLEEE